MTKHHDNSIYCIVLLKNKRLVSGGNDSKIIVYDKNYINPDLEIKGILITLVDRRTNLSKEIKNELNEIYGSEIKIYNTEIPLAIKTAEASIKGKSVFEYDKKGTVAQSYNNFAKEVLQDERESSKNEPTIIR
jgi:chromosome partitioning protein